MSLDVHLAEALRPLIKQMVDEAVEERRLHWRWKSVREVAKLLDLSEVAVRQRARRGKLPAKVVGRRLYIDVEALDEQIDALP